MKQPLKPQPQQSTSKNSRRCIFRSNRISWCKKLSRICNIGGSIGIASATTYLFRREQFHTNLLGAHVTAYNPQTQMMARGLESAMMAHGSDPVTAARQSYVAMWCMVERQSAMVSFVDTFQAMAVVFLLVLPLLFVMKKPKHHSGGAGMH